MKVTQAMREAFRAAPIPHGWKGDELLTARLQAVLDQIEQEYVPIEALKFNAVMVRKAQDAAGLEWENDARAAVHAVLSCVREKANALSGDPA